jgi:phosphate transport system substrate-binding protein
LPQIRRLLLSLWARAACLSLAAWSPGLYAEEVRAQGSAAVSNVLSDAISTLRSEFDVTLQLRAEGSSSQAIYSVGIEAIDMALSMREITSADRATFPARRFEEFRLGWEVFALMVSSDVWESGVRALSREQMIGIYEGRITNWKELGGEDRPLRFYAPPQGKGAWEQLVRWLYEDVRMAPPCKAEVAADPKEARELVEFHTGSISVAPPRYSDERRVYSLGLQKAPGDILRLTHESVSGGKYPMARPVSLIVGYEPTGGVRRLIDFFTSERGQAAVAKSGLMPVKKD